MRCRGRIRNAAGDKREIETSRVRVGILAVISLIFCTRSLASGRVVANERESGTAYRVCQSMKMSSSFHGQRHYLWRAVDQDGQVLDILVQRQRIISLPTAAYGAGPEAVIPLLAC